MIESKSALNQNHDTKHVDRYNLNKYINIFERLYSGIHRLWCYKNKSRNISIR